MSTKRSRILGAVYTSSSPVTSSCCVASTPATGVEKSSMCGSSRLRQPRRLLDRRPAHVHVGDGWALHVLPRPGVAIPLGSSLAFVRTGHGVDNTLGGYNGKRESLRRTYP